MADSGILRKQLKHPNLRKLAEAALRERMGGTGEPKDPALEEKTGLLHQLWVHQIELEMQNEELRRVQEELSASLDRYSELYDFAPVGYLTLSKRGLIREANLTAANLLGTERGRLLNKPLTKFIEKKDQDRFFLFRQAVLKGSSHQVCDLDLVRGHGTQISVQLNGVADKGPDGAWRVTLSDVTEHRRLEQSLIHAQKMQVIGQLTGGIAHDFNNLLQVIEINLGLIRENMAGDSDGLEILDGAIRAEQRGAGLVKNLLAFCRRQTLQPKWLDINAWIEGEIDLLDRTLGENIAVRTELSEQVGAVFVDEGWLANALLNVAINGRAAMPNGGTLTIASSCRHLVPGGDGALPAGIYAEIRVSDTGCGMSGETLNRAFEPYFTTRAVGEGSGLGLSMVDGFVRQSGGRVTIESEVGKGTTVRILLPMESVEKKHDHKKGNGKSEKTRGHSLKILLVEDDDDVRKSLAKILRTIGHEVVEVEKSRSACVILDKDMSFNLLLSDVILSGGKSGIELAQAASVLRPDIKVILMSGHSNATLEQVGFEEAPFPLIRKPFSKAVLSRILNSVSE